MTQFTLVSFSTIVWIYFLCWWSFAWMLLVHSDQFWLKFHKTPYCTIMQVQVLSESQLSYRHGHTLSQSAFSRHLCWHAAQFTSSTCQHSRMIVTSYSHTLKQYPVRSCSKFELSFETFLNQQCPKFATLHFCHPLSSSLFWNQCLPVVKGWYLPIVAMCEASSNNCSVNRSKKLVLPTPVSPTRIILIR